MAARILILGLSLCWMLSCDPVQSTKEDQIETEHKQSQAKPRMQATPPIETQPKISADIPSGKVSLFDGKKSRPGSPL